MAGSFDRAEDAGRSGGLVRLGAVDAGCVHGNSLLGERGCETNGAGNFERIAFWRTPVANCGGGRECVPYHEWVTAYIAVIGGR